MEFIVSQFPGILFGAVAGAVVMFFVARKNPEWVQSIYEKQKGFTGSVEDKLREAEAKIASLELDKVINAKVQEALDKLKKV